MLGRLSLWLTKNEDLKGTPSDCLPISYCIFLLTFVGVSAEHQTAILQGQAGCLRWCDLEVAAERGTRGARESKCE